MPNEIAQSLKGFNLLVDGYGLGGVINEIELPTLSVQGVDHQSGGMNGPIELDMGIEKLECKFTVGEYNSNLLRQVGKMGVDVTGLTVRGVLSPENPLLVTPHTVTMRGRIKKFEPGNWKPGDKTEAKFEAVLCYYRLDHGLRTIYEIDLINCVRVIDGLDQMAAQRAVLAI